MSTRVILGGHQGSMVHRRFPLPILSAFLGFISLGVEAQSTIPQYDAWVADGAVNAMAQIGDTLYLCGRFQRLTPHTGNGVPIDTASGNPVAPFPKVNGDVWACVPDGEGGWFIGGDFIGVGGRVRTRLAHTLSGGSVDPNWAPGADGTVYALCRSGSTLYAGGMFTSVDGVSRECIAAIDCVSGTVTEWNPGVRGGSWNTSVRAIAVSGSDVFMGGYFDNVGEEQRIDIAAVDAVTGITTTWNPSASSEATHSFVSAIEVSGSVVYVGGDFDEMGGQPRSNIAALDISTGIATEWAPNADNDVLALAASGQVVYLAGRFSSVGGETRRRIAAIDVITGEATDWRPDLKSGTFYPTIYTIAVSDSVIYAGGTYVGVLLSPFGSNLIAIDSTTGNRTDWDPHLNNAVYTAALDGSTLFVGGYFTGMGGVPRSGLASVDTATGLPTDWNPGMWGEFLSLMASGEILYVGGRFEQIPGQSNGAIAAFDTTSGNLMNWVPTLHLGNYTQYVEAIAASDSMLYISGHKEDGDGERIHNLIAIDLTTDTGVWGAGAPTLDSSGRSISSLALAGSALIIGGDFRAINNVERRNLAALNATTGNLLDWNPVVSSSHLWPVRALEVSGETLYVGGDFARLGGEIRNGVGAFDILNGELLDWNLDLSATSGGPAVNSITLFNDLMYLGGEFTAVGDQACQNLIAIDPTTGTIRWNPGASAGPGAIVVSDSMVFIGGGFRDIGGESRSNLAKFGPVLAGILLE